MNAEAHEVDQCVREWWLHGTADDALFQRILEHTLTAASTSASSLVPFSRALRILEARPQRPAIQKRIDELRVALDSLRVRELQVDQLGDLDNEPEALFAILGDDVSSLEGFTPEPLRRARLAHQQSRAGAARAFLGALGWERFSPNVAATLRIAVDDLEEREQYESWGLFVDHIGEGLALGVRLGKRDAGYETLWSEANEEMRQQAGIALRLGLEGQGWEAIIEWPASFIGESIGLPLYVAALVVRGLLPRHSLTVSTGRLDIGGEVKRVSGIKEKVEAARRIGMRRVLVPRDNLEEAKGAAADDLIVLPIGHVKDVLAAFQQPLSSVELGYAGLIRLVRVSVSDHQLVVKSETEESQGRRFVVANAGGTANIWIYRNGRVWPDGPAGSAMDAVRQLIAERVPPEPTPREPLSFQLPTQELQNAYRAALQDAAAVPEVAHEHEAWRMRLTRGRSRVTVVQYQSGKCVVQGTAPAWDLAYGAAQQVTQSIGGINDPRRATPSSPGQADPSGDDSDPHIGTDEAGKGDYFGPLVSAAVFVDRETAANLRRLGVRDSKTLSDKRVRELAGEIKRIAEGQYAVTPINPRKFNELYDQFRREGKNLNSLLAWGHGRSIDNLLSRQGSRRPQAKYVVVDQFADKHYVEERTHRAGIPVHQRHKAETDIAVAAASILARDGFLQWIEQWSERTQILLPKGASPQVIEAAKQFVRRWGAKWLADVAKLNFRTTREVLANEDVHTDKRPPWISEATDPTREG